MGINSKKKEYTTEHTNFQGFCRCCCCRYFLSLKNKTNKLVRFVTSIKKNIVHRSCTVWFNEQNNRFFLHDVVFFFHISFLSGVEAGAVYASVWYMCVA